MPTNIRTVATGVHADRLVEHLTTLSTHVAGLERWAVEALQLVDEALHSTNLGLSKAFDDDEVHRRVVDEIRDTEMTHGLGGLLVAVAGRIETIAGRASDLAARLDNAGGQELSAEPLIRLVGDW